ncbi:MAG: cytochrome c biogenesis protein CcsA [Betaproteobacteria bacterium]|nr:cytochrome c biogenesis protein CcsA [Betaproteobacteria bacterium]
MADAKLYFITAALYLLLGVRVWVALRSDAGGTEARGGSRGGLSRVLILCAWIVHGAVLHRALLSDGGLDLSLGHSLSLIAWVTVAMYWIVSFRYRMGVLQPLILVLAAAMVLSPLVFPEDKQVAYSGLLAFKIHLVVSLMAYGLFAIAALHAILMGVMEQRLHSHDKRLSRLGELPSLVAMDSLLFQMILVGFLLLTAALASGVFFSEALFGKPLPFNHKVVFSFISWLIYAGLLAGRQIWGVRGRRAARWTLVGFAMLLVGYVGSKFVLEIILHRG